MPATSPPLREASAAALADLGQRIRAQRKQLGINATTTAEAAGMSRVTLHRIEQGEASVSIGAWMNAVTALGLRLDLIDPRDIDKPASVLPETIRLADFPQLAALAWQLHDVERLSPQDALDLYERNWRHVDQSALGPDERELIERLTRALGGGRLLV
jgi:transcriptional regulator with XRE-family HTH domain